MMTAIEVSGTVVSNNGRSAMVRFTDGAKKWFDKLEHESSGDFLRKMSVGATIQVQRQCVSLKHDKDLIESIKACFRHDPVLVPVDNGFVSGVRIGVGQDSISVLARPDCSRPGHSGKWFIISHGEGNPLWVELTWANFEYVLGELAAEYNRFVRIAS